MKSSRFLDIECTPPAVSAIQKRPPSECPLVIVATLVVTAPSSAVSSMSCPAGSALSSTVPYLLTVSKG